MTKKPCSLSKREQFVLEQISTGRKISDIKIEGAGRSAAQAAVHRVRVKLELEDKPLAAVIAAAFRKGWLT